MIKLYIDFDGVILNTIPVFDELIKNADVDLKDEVAKRTFFSTLDWFNILENTEEINDAFCAINRLVKSKLFDIYVLTHVNSMSEAHEKAKFIRKRCSNVSVITVPKTIDKNIMVNSKDAILIDDYLPNLVLWQSSGGISIKFSDSNKPCQFIKITNLLDIFDIVVKNEQVKTLIKQKKYYY